MSTHRPTTHKPAHKAATHSATAQPSSHVHQQGTSGPSSASLVVVGCVLVLFLLGLVYFVSMQRRGH